MALEVSPRLAPGKLSRRLEPDEPPFDVGVTSYRSRQVIVLSGEIDCAAAPQLRAVHSRLVLDARRIVFDCKHVTFMDAAGIGFLLSALGHRPQDRLADVPPPMAALFRIVGREDVLARHSVASAHDLRLQRSTS